MRSTVIAAAAFAATALAVPYANPDVLTQYATDVVYVTNVYTVTEGAATSEAAAPTTVAAADNSQQTGSAGGWHWPHKHQSKKTKTRTRTHTQAPASPSPEPSSETSTWEAPSTTEAAPQPSQTYGNAPPSGGDLSGYNDICVGHHNVHRSNHSAPDLSWDSGLAATAQKIAESCVYAHNT